MLLAVTCSAEVELGVQQGEVGVGSHSADVAVGKEVHRSYHLGKSACFHLVNYLVTDCARGQEDGSNSNFGNVNVSQGKDQAEHRPHWYGRV